MKESARNLEIYRLRKEERMTLEAIGRRFGLSRERVRQLVKRVAAALGEQRED